jgi:hypothetical protein
MIGPAGVSEGEPGLWHDHTAFRHGGRDRVEGAEALVPIRRGHEDRHDIPSWLFLESDIFGKEATRRP